MARQKSEFKTASLTTVTQVFGCTRDTVWRWVDDGCPKNPDETYNTEDVFRWYVEKERRRAAGDTDKARKTDLECQKLEAQIQRIKDETIDRTYHEQVLVSRASSLRSFFEKCAMAFATEFVGLNLDQARVRLAKIFKRALDEYSDVGEDDQGVAGLPPAQDDDSDGGGQPDA